MVNHVGLIAVKPSSLNVNSQTVSRSAVEQRGNASTFCPSLMWDGAARTEIGA
jgi:hypothetical protein